MADLQLRGVRKSFGEVHVIHGVDLDVRHGQFVVFVGPSGCGKSTLLRMVCGLEGVSGGDVLIGGRRVNDVPAAQRGLAIVFQSYALYPHMTVRQNMAFGLENLGTPKPVIDQRIQEAARMLRLEEYLARKPTALSGGQRQRVAIGRAIVREPEIFLFDEPLSNLDAELRVGMRAELAGLHRRLGATMIYVTHDQVEAMTMADKIVVLQAGRVEQVGSPLDLYHHPANLFVAGFIGSPRMNMLPARVVGADGMGVALDLSNGARVTVPAAGGALRPGDAVTLGVRPEALRTDHAGPLDGEVIVVERLGGLTLLHVSLQGGMPDGGTIVVQSDGSDATRPHQPVRLAFDPGAARLFDGSGSALQPLERHPLAA